MKTCEVALKDKKIIFELFIRSQFGKSWQNLWNNKIQLLRKNTVEVLQSRGSQSIKNFNKMKLFNKKNNLKEKKNTFTKYRLKLSSLINQKWDEKS